MQTFFTSDTHYGHGNIIGYCSRPFASLAEMNDTMIERHNAVVGPEDRVIHVGDFAFGGADYIRMIAGRLNGIFTLVQGNHDRKPNVLRALGWVVCGRMILELDGVRLFIRHKPEYEGNWMGEANYHLCGHVHTSWKKHETNRRLDPAKLNIINVGVDQWDYAPRTWPELLAG